MVKYELGTKVQIVDEDSVINKAVFEVSYIGPETTDPTRRIYQIVRTDDKGTGLMIDRYHLGMSFQIVN